MRRYYLAGRFIGNNSNPLICLSVSCSPDSSYNLDATTRARRSYKELNYWAERVGSDEIVKIREKRTTPAARDAIRRALKNRHGLF